jgi:twinkle protein
MGVQIDALPHSCGTKKGLKVFAHEDDRIDGYCFACNTPIRHPYGEEKKVGDVKLPPKKTEEEIQENLAEIAGYPVVDVPKRKLRAELINEFGAKTSLSEWDGETPTAIYWPVTKDTNFVGWHVKTLGENKYSYNVGHTKGGDLLNWSQAKVSGAYRLIIAEGPEDMASIYRFYQMYGKEEYFPAVTSLPRGAGSAKSVLTKHSKDIVRLFKEVVFCFDNDEAGHQAVQDAMLILPWAKSVLLPYKDANECLIKGAAKAAYNQLAFKSDKPKNTRIIEAHSLHEKGREPAKYGELSWPFPSLQEATRGIRLGETGYFGAGVKMGKGELRNSLISHFITQDKRKVLVASFEESNVKTYKMVAGKIAGKFFHDPDRPFDFKAYDHAGEILKENLFLLNVYGGVEWKSLKQDIITAVNEDDVKVVFIDPITNLTNAYNAAEANTILSDFAQDLSAMALDMNFFAGMFCHLKAPDGSVSSEQRLKSYSNQHYIGLGNCPHERGGNVYSNQFAGSRSMMRSCNFMIGLEGNKDPDLPKEIRNIRHINLLEEREFGESGIFPIYWDGDTSLFTELHR